MTTTLIILNLIAFYFFLGTIAYMLGKMSVEVTS